MIGVVTVTFNSADVIEAFLDSMLAQTYSDFILYAVDNQSTDDTILRIKNRKDSRIKLFQLPQNIGFAAGTNTGIKSAFDDGCDSVLLLNNDVEFEPQLIDKLLDGMKRSGCSISTPKIHYYFDKSLLWYAGSHFIKKLSYIAHHRGLGEVDKGQYDKEEVVDFTPMCCVLMKKEVFDDVGLLDEKFFTYYEDTDYFYRVKMQGKHCLYYITNTVFYHKVGQLTKSKKGNLHKYKFGDFHIRLTTRNRVYYYLKQNTPLSWLNILYFYIWINVKFFLSDRYYKNLKTWWLIQKSFFEGFKI